MAMAWVVPHPDGCMARRGRDPDPQDIEIGRRLRTARESRGRTQLEVATELGHAESTYGRREAGEIRVRLPELLKIARFLDLEPEALIPGGPMPTAPMPRPARALLRELEASITAIEPTDPDLRAMLLEANQLPAGLFDEFKQWLRDKLDGARRTNGPAS